MKETNASMKDRLNQCTCSNGSRQMYTGLLPSRNGSFATLPLLEDPGDVRPVIGGFGFSLRIDIPAPAANLSWCVPMACWKVMETAVFVNAFDALYALHGYAFASVRCSVNVFRTKPTMNSSPPSMLTVSSS